VSRSTRRRVRIAAALALVVAAAVAVAAQWAGGATGAGAVIAVELACAMALAARAIHRPDHRLAWALLALALLAWTAGDVAYALDPDAPVPSIADAGWLAFYPPAAAGLVMLTAARCRCAGLAPWLDGAIAGLAAAAVGTAALGPGAVETSGGALATAVTLAYPAGDIALLATVVLALAVGGRADGPFLLLAVGLGLTAFADGLYLALYAQGAWPAASALDALWPAATLAVALAAWLARPAAAPRPARGLRQIAVPAAGALAALAVLVLEVPLGLPPTAIWLAAATLILVTGRFALTFAEKERALRELHRRATTDPLTDLPNHREFHERLRAEVERARRHGRELSVVVIDIDHFKLVNDTHGHPVGDRVLAHVATTLRRALRSGDTLARIGGEEFGWILPETTALPAWQAVERAREILAASPAPTVGTVDFSAGICDLEHVDRSLGAPDLLRLADGALYWAKRNGRGITFRYSPTVVTALTAEEMAGTALREQSLAAVRALARAVDERLPHTHQHSERVAALAVAIARDLGWDEDRRALLREAALVHDTGVIGVPDDVLLKPGPLTSRERALMEAHAAAGSRIVAGALSAEQAEWIHRHHERPDGRGYPGGLSGDAIPDGARILAVADAFDAMTTERSYRRALAPAEALAAVRDGAGTQFDPAAAAALQAVAGRIAEVLTGS
jgi:diguanylate cyclase (GGDEF)-like protein